MTASNATVRQLKTSIESVAAPTPEPPANRTLPSDIGVDVAKRREIIFDIQRYLAKQQYYVQMPSAIQIAVWDGALKNYAPNVSYDYGGRLVAAWLDR